MFHLSQMDQIFLKSLADVVRTSRTTSSYDQLTFTTQTIVDIKNEMQNKQESIRLQALLKLFFISMEGNNIRWAEFQIINLMGSSDFQLKLTAQLAAHLVIDNQSQGLIMVTNFFKKELKNNYIECSAALSCLGTIANKDLGDSIIDIVMGLITHTKPVIRKKAIAVLTKIFTMNPNRVQGNLEKITQQLEKESNISVLSCGISLFSQILKILPETRKVFMILVYNLLCKQKSNWLLIKLVRISNKLIELDNRFLSKLVEEYKRLLNQTNSKSLQFELVYSIMKHFKNQAELYSNAGDILRQFLNNADANLRCLGLECLSHISTTDGLLEFQEQILDSFKKSDYFSKIQILLLFKEYTNQKNFQVVIEFFLQNIDVESGQKIIEILLFIISKDKFINVDDPEKLLLIYIPIIAEKIDSQENANKLKDILFDLLTRVPELKAFTDKLCNKILQQYSTQSATLSGPTLHIVQRHTQLKYELSHREIIFKSLIMIVGESVKLLDKEALFNIVQLIEKLNILNCYESSLPDIDSLLFKVYIQLLKNNEDTEQIKNIQEIIQSIYMKLHSISISQITLFYESLIKDKEYNQIIELYEYFKEDLPPINSEAQKLIKPPEGLDLNEKFLIDISEIEKIKNQTIETQENQQQQQQQQQQQKVVDEQQNLNEINEDISNQESIQQPLISENSSQKTKFTINRQEELPPGINSNDLLILKQDE